MFIWWCTHINSDWDKIILSYGNNIWNILHVHSQVKALESHREPALIGFQATEEQVNTPMTSVSVEDFHLFIEVQKAHAAPVETDIKDAKRRINGAKGPKKAKKKTAVADESEESDVDVAGSA